MSLEWHGDALLKGYRQAAKWAIDETMEKMVKEARTNHPGWRSISGRAESSIQVLEPAKDRKASVVGRWGSVGVPYMLRLEFQHGRALISSYDKLKGKLAGIIRTKFVETRVGRGWGRRPTRRRRIGQVSGGL